MCLSTRVVVCGRRASCLRVSLRISQYRLSRLAVCAFSLNYRILLWQLSFNRNQKKVCDGESFQLCFNYRVHLIYKVRPLKMVVERTEGPSLGNRPAAQKYVSKYHGDDLSPGTTLPRLS